jgi:hypothetical protein
MANNILRGLAGLLLLIGIWICGYVVLAAMVYGLHSAVETVTSSLR